MRRACIDIGSNTTRLLVADCTDGGLLEIHQERAFTLIGHSLQDGAIPPGKVDEVVAVVCAQLARARELGAAEVSAVATAAIRTAANGRSLTDAIEKTCGLEVDVLSGEEEARLAFVGAAGTLGHVPDGELGVVDVGGGSSELVVGEVPDKVSWSASFALGSAGLARSFMHSDPPAPDELRQARDRVRSELGRLAVPHPTEAVAVGGSATSLSQLAGALLDADGFTRALGVLTNATAAQTARRFGLAVERVRLLPAGLLILQAASESFGLALRVASGGLREGVLLEGGNA